jgi:hypothetical protein
MFFKICVILKKKMLFLKTVVIVISFMVQKRVSCSGKNIDALIISLAD